MEGCSLRGAQTPLRHERGAHGLWPQPGPWAGCGLTRKRTRQHILKGVPLVLAGVSEVRGRAPVITWSLRKGGGVAFSPLPQRPWLR